MSRTLLIGALLLAAPLPALAQPAAEPERVIVNLTEDPATSIAITWRTPRGTATDAAVEYAVATPGAAFEKQAQRVTATREAVNFVDRDGNRVDQDYFSAVLTGLRPATRYVYRVGREGAWSPWRDVRTAATGNAPFTFLYFGDVQNGIRSLGGRIVREAARATPDAAFALYAGDLVNNGDNDAQWGEWFGMAPDFHAEVPSLMTPGNHEFFRYEGQEKKQLTPLWRHQYTLPANGPADDVRETVYRVDYQGVRLISLDAEMTDEVPESARQQVAWLERQLADNPNRWTILFLHYPLYSTAQGRESDDIRALLEPLLDRYHVDLVLQGHDHGYGRGRPHAQGPAYVVSVAGPKQYPLGNIDWATRKGSGLQLYQQIAVTPTTLTLRAYTADGALYDAFRLDKPGKGPATLVDMAPRTPEQILVAPKPQ